MKIIIFRNIFHILDTGNGIYSPVASFSSVEIKNRASGYKVMFIWKFCKKGSHTGIFPQTLCRVPGHYTRVFLAERHSAGKIWRLFFRCFRGFSGKIKISTVFISAVSESQNTHCAQRSRRVRDPVLTRCIRTHSLGLAASSCCNKHRRASWRRRPRLPPHGPRADHTEPAGTGAAH